MSSKKLEGKVAVVTGASKGIGASIAKHLAAEGAAVVVNYASSRDAAENVVAEIEAAGGKAVTAHGDLSKQEDVSRLFAETKQQLEQRQSRREPQCGEAGLGDHLAGACASICGGM